MSAHWWELGWSALAFLIVSALMLTPASAQMNNHQVSAKPLLIVNDSIVCIVECDDLAERCMDNARRGEQGNASYELCQRELLVCRRRCGEPHALPDVK
jgi:hypothetical protein